MESDFVARSLIQCALPKCFIRIRLPQKALTFKSFATEIKDTYLLVAKVLKQLSPQVGIKYPWSVIMMGCK